MKIGLVSPTFPPDRCGVADHSFQLKEELTRMGIRVTLFRGLPPTSELASFDALLIQYTPNIWAKNFLRLNADLIQFCRRAKKTTKVFLMVHELHYPIQPNLRGLVFGIGQWLQFRALSRVVGWSFFSYHAPQKKYPIHSSVLPVGSNIPVSKMDPDTRLQKDPNLIRLLHFGGNHPTHLVDWTVEALRKVSDAFPQKKVELVWIGQKDLAGNTNPNILLRGYLPEEQISVELQKADLILAPYMDGVSTRRGTFMAALAHGAVTATTNGWATATEIEWKNFSAMSEGNATNYGDLVVHTLQHPERMRELKSNALAAYQENFSWDQIAQKLMTQIKLVTKSNYEH